MTPDHFSDVAPAASRGVFVASATTPGVWWLVSARAVGNEFVVTCSCPAGRQIEKSGSERHCRHVRRAQEHATVTAPPKRPTMPPAVSALTD